MAAPGKVNQGFDLCNSSSLSQCIAQAICKPANTALPVSPLMRQYCIAQMFAASIRTEQLQCAGSPCGSAQQLDTKTTQPADSAAQRPSPADTNQQTTTHAVVTTALPIINTPTQANLQDALAPTCTPLADIPSAGISAAEHPNTPRAGPETPATLLTMNADNHAAVPIVPIKPDLGTKQLLSPSPTLAGYTVTTSTCATTWCHTNPTVTCILTEEEVKAATARLQLAAAGTAAATPTSSRWSSYNSPASPQHPIMMQPTSMPASPSVANNHPPPASPIQPRHNLTSLVSAAINNALFRLNSGVSTQPSNPSMLHEYSSSNVAAAAADVIASHQQCEVQEGQAMKAIFNATTDEQQHTLQPSSHEATCDSNQQPDIENSRYSQPHTAIDIVCSPSDMVPVSELGMPGGVAATIAPCQETLSSLLPLQQQQQLLHAFSSHKTVNAGVPKKKVTTVQQLLRKQLHHPRARCLKHAVKQRLAQEFLRYPAGGGELKHRLSHCTPQTVLECLDDYSTARARLEAVVVAFDSEAGAAIDGSATVGVMDRTGPLSMASSIHAAMTNAQSLHFYMGIGSIGNGQLDELDLDDVAMHWKQDVQVLRESPSADLPCLLCRSHSSSRVQPGCGTRQAALIGTAARTTATAPKHKPCRLSDSQVRAMSERASRFPHEWAVQAEVSSFTDAGQDVWLSNVSRDGTIQSPDLYFDHRNPTAETEPIDRSATNYAMTEWLPADPLQYFEEALGATDRVGSVYGNAAMAPDVLLAPGSSAAAVFASTMLSE